MTEDFDMENLSQAIVLGASAIGAGLAMIAGLGPDTGAKTCDHSKPCTYCRCAQYDSL